MTDAERHLDNPGVRVVFALASGPALRREWTWRQVFEGEAPDWIFQPDPPWWLERSDGISDPPETEWHDPLLPIEFRGRVVQGHEDLAREWVWGGS